MTTQLWTPKGDVEIGQPTIIKLPQIKLERISGNRFRVIDDLPPNKILFPEEFGKPFTPKPQFIDKNGVLRTLWPVGGGAAGNWTFPNSARTDLLNGTFDIDTDSWKEALFLSTSNIGVGSTTYAGISNEHANANGYTTGGIAVTLTLAGTSTVTVDVSSDPIWTASGGSIVARFVALYEVGGRLLCYALLDSAPADVTATDGNTLTVAANASGVFQLA